MTYLNVQVHAWMFGRCGQHSQRAFAVELRNSDDLLARLGQLAELGRKRNAQVRDQQDHAVGA